MKYLIIISIKIYQTFFPKKFRGKCLFKESCSNHVLRKTREAGFSSGIKAFKFRYKNCKPNYQLSSKNGKTILITIANHVLEEHEIDRRILRNN